MALIAIIVFLFVFVGTLVLFSLFGGASMGNEAEQIRERLLGKSKSKKKKKKGEVSEDSPTLIKNEVQQKSIAVKVQKQL